MAVMKELWDESEFANDLNLSSQNLRDQAARIEKSLGNVRATIREEVNADNGESLFDAVYLERNEGQDLEQEELYEINNNSVEEEDLHTQVNHQTAGMEWIEDVREAMREVVPEISTIEFKLTGDKVGQTIRKKKN